MPHKFDEQLKDHKYFKAFLRLAAAYYELPDDMVSELYYDRYFFSDQSFSVSNRHFARTNNMAECVLAFPEGHPTRNELLNKINNAEDASKEFSLYNIFNAVQERLSGVGILRTIYNPPGLTKDTVIAGVVGIGVESALNAGLGLVACVYGGSTLVAGLFDTRPKEAVIRRMQLDSAYEKSQNQKVSAIGAGDEEANASEDQPLNPAGSPALSEELSIYQRWMFEPKEALGKNITQLMVLINTSPHEYQEGYLTLLDNILKSLMKLSTEKELSSLHIQQLLNITLTTSWYDDSSHHDNRLVPRFMKLCTHSPITLIDVISKIYAQRKRHSQELLLMKPLSLSEADMALVINACQNNREIIYSENGQLKHINQSMLDFDLLDLTGDGEFDAEKMPAYVPNTLISTLTPSFKSGIVRYLNTSQDSNSNSETAFHSSKMYRYYYVNRTKDPAATLRIIRLQIKEGTQEDFAGRIQFRLNFVVRSQLKFSLIIHYIENASAIFPAQDLQIDLEKINAQITRIPETADHIELTDHDCVKTVYQQVSPDSYIRITAIDALMASMSFCKPVDRLKVLMSLLRAQPSLYADSAFLEHLNQATKAYPHTSEVIYLILKDIINHGTAPEPQDHTKTKYSLPPAPSARDMINRTPALREMDLWMRPLPDPFKYIILKDILTNPKPEVIEWLNTRPSAKQRIGEWIAFCQNFFSVPTADDTNSGSLFQASTMTINVDPRITAILNKSFFSFGTDKSSTFSSSSTLMRTKDDREEEKQFLGAKSLRYSGSDDEL